MRRLVSSLFAVLLALALVAGCGSNSKTSSVGSSGAATSSADCPVGSNTKSFAKTRFVADLGAAFGTFHRYIYKPYKAGKFQKGADGRVLAFVKAGATALLDKHLLGNAIDNAKANPTLCKVLITPLNNLSTTLGNIASKIKGGDISGIDDAEKSLQSVKSGAAKQGDTIAEDENANVG